MSGPLLRECTTLQVAQVQVSASSAEFGEKTTCLQGGIMFVLILLGLPAGAPSVDRPPPLSWA